MDKILLKNYNKMRAKQIAEMLGVTKNAVIGRAKRLGLSRTKKTHIKSHKPRGITFVDLTNATCRWPVPGTGADMMYCGGEVHKEQSYCLEHCRIAFYGFKK